jgi:NAD(P)-dependent dehydrogenase (short-subunit alcohol dehydrogenase family)
LASAGADVFVTDFNRQAESAEVVAAIRALGRKAGAVQGDLRSVSICEHVVAACVAEFGSIDVLVNNAGNAQHQPIEEITEQSWDAALDLHLKAPFFLTQFALPALRASSRGTVINIASEQAYIGEAQLCHYTAAKGGLRTLTKSLALALAPAITVNCVCPGPTATDKFKLGQEFRSGADRTLPRRRWATPEDVAKTVVFLASDDADSYTGQTLDPNCGAVMD